MLRVLGTGRLANDPELKPKKKEGDRTLTEFGFYQLNGRENEPPVPVVAWGHLAETICKYCHKGDRIAINGKISAKKYTTQSGEERRSIEIWIDSFEFLDVKKPEDEGLPF